MRIDKCVGIASLVVVSMVGIAVSAQGPRHGGPGGPGMFGPLGVLHSITLTSDQQTKVRQILDSSRSQMQSASQQLFQARCAYDHAVIAGSGDLSTLAANLTAAESNMTSVETATLQAVAKILTADQITEIGAAACAPPQPGS